MLIDLYQRCLCRQMRARPFDIPNRRDVTNELTVADRCVVLRIVQVQKAARACVNHALVPAEPKPVSTAKHRGKLFVMNWSV